VIRWARGWKVFKFLHDSLKTYFVDGYGIVLALFLLKGIGLAERFLSILVLARQLLKGWRSRVPRSLKRLPSNNPEVGFSPKAIT
jgi:hypothetical protein